MPDFSLLQCDALSGLRSLKDFSVHCVVTSPPYYSLRTYRDVEPIKWGDGWVGVLGNEPHSQQYIEHLAEICREIRRVLRPDGAFWLNLGDTYQGSPSSLLGIPWRVASRLRQDGWAVRNEVPWIKPNNMPESITNRLTKGIESVFLLVKSRKYYYDHYAVRHPMVKDLYRDGEVYRGSSTKDYDTAKAQDPSASKTRILASMAGRTDRQLWAIDLWRESLRISLGEGGPLLSPDGELVALSVRTAPYRDAHYSTFPPRLVEPLILLTTSGGGCCASCGAQYQRNVSLLEETKRWGDAKAQEARNQETGCPGGTGCIIPPSVCGPSARRALLGWSPSCGCGAPKDRPVVLDPFAGTSTTGEVALKLGRKYIGIEPGWVSIKLSRKRLREWEEALSD